VFLFVFALLLLALATRLRVRSLTGKQHRIPWDGPLGKRVADVVSGYDMRPNNLILLPSLLANAFAMRDGSVIVTTAMRKIATDGEIAGIVAHELSHVRDGDVRKLGISRRIALLPVLAVFGFAVAFGLNGHYYDAEAPAVIGVVFLLGAAGSWLHARVSQRLEYKCDAAAVSMGLGPELASGLKKLSRYIGSPSHWVGVDHYLLTHPSLDRRLERIRREEQQNAKRP
jgi:heat shock protein HtpX